MRLLADSPVPPPPVPGVIQKVSKDGESTNLIASMTAVTDASTGKLYFQIQVKEVVTALQQQRPPQTPNPEVKVPTDIRMVPSSVTPCEAKKPPRSPAESPVKKSDAPQLKLKNRPSGEKFVHEMNTFFSSLKAEQSRNGMSHDGQAVDAPTRTITGGCGPSVARDSHVLNPPSDRHPANRATLHGAIDRIDFAPDSAVAFAEGDQVRHPDRTGSRLADAGHAPYLERISSLPLETGANLSTAQHPEGTLPPRAALISNHPNGIGPAPDKPLPMIPGRRSTSTKQSLSPVDQFDSVSPTYEQIVLRNRASDESSGPAWPPRDSSLGSKFPLPPNVPSAGPPPKNPLRDTIGPSRSPSMHVKRNSAKRVSYDHDAYKNSKTAGAAKLALRDDKTRARKRRDQQMRAHRRQTAESNQPSSPSVVAPTTPRELLRTVPSTEHARLSSGDTTAVESNADQSQADRTPSATWATTTPIMPPSRPVPAVPKAPGCNVNTDFSFAKPVSPPPSVDLPTHPSLRNPSDTAIGRATSWDTDGRSSHGDPFHHLSHGSYYSHLQISRHAQLEARVDVLERQKKLLEAALMAVLQTSGHLNNCPCSLPRSEDANGRCSGMREGYVANNASSRGSNSPALDAYYATRLTVNSPPPGTF